jgi:hypothetical protein
MTRTREQVEWMGQAQDYIDQLSERIDALRPFAEQVAAGSTLASHRDRADLFGQMVRWRREWESRLEELAAE